MRSDAPSEVEFLRMLADETRFKILKLLLSGEFCACEIARRIGEKQPATSMQLAKLLEAGILKCRRDGKMIKYSLNDNRVVRIFRILECKQSGHSGFGRPNFSRRMCRSEN